MEIQCGKTISEECKGATIPMNDAGFELMVAEGVDALLMFINVAQQTATKEMTVDKQKAVNAAGCAVETLGTNFWHFAAALYYASRQFGL